MDFEVVERKTEPSLDPDYGTLWKDRNNDRFYLLAQVDYGKYVLINLESGNRFTSGPVDKENVEEAFEHHLDDVNADFVPFEGTIKLSQEV